MECWKDGRVEDWNDGMRPCDDSGGFSALCALRSAQLKPRIK